MADNELCNCCVICGREPTYKDTNGNIIQCPCVNCLVKVTCTTMCTAFYNYKFRYFYEVTYGAY